MHTCSTHTDTQTERERERERNIFRVSVWLAMVVKLTAVVMSERVVEYCEFITLLSCS